MADARDNRRVFLDPESGNLMRNDRKIEEKVETTAREATGAAGTKRYRPRSPLEDLFEKFKQCRSLIEDCSLIQRQTYERLKLLEARVEQLEKRATVAADIDSGGDKNGRE